MISYRLLYNPRLHLQRHLLQRLQQPLQQRQWYLLQQIWHPHRPLHKAGPKLVRPNPAQRHILSRYHCHRRRRGRHMKNHFGTLRKRLRCTWLACSDGKWRFEVLMAKRNRCSKRGGSLQRGIGLGRMSRLEFVPRTIEMDCILFMVWATTSYVRLRYWVWCNGHVCFSSCHLVCTL